MKSLVAFIKKEITDQIRSSKLLFLAILFLLFGIMNPAMAKLTPWLLEMMADTLAESGMIITSVTVSAMDSWVQFFKNMPMGLLVFILMESSTFTKEYQSGTLVLSLTKGLERYKVVLSKTVVLITLWTLGYGLCFGITYGYNAYFWDNSVAENLLFSVICWWFFGLWAIFVMVFFSVLGTSNTDVLIGTGSIVLASYVLGLFQKFKEFVPTRLIDGNSLIYGFAETKTYCMSIVITVVLSIACFVISFPIFNKKQM